MSTGTCTRRLTQLVSVAAATAVVACLGVGAAPYLANDHALRVQSAELDRIALPAGTVEVARHDEVGLQVCCSNHCDFFTGRTLDAPLDPEGMRAAISHPELTLVPAAEVDASGVRISGLATLAKKSQGEPAGHRYYLYRFEQRYEGFAFAWDLRCH